MERIAGHNWAEIRDVSYSIAVGLDHLHSNGILHGDVKPRNVVRIDGKWILIDLDASCPLSKEGRAGLKYSEAYCPPEMMRLVNPVREQLQALARSQRFPAAMLFLLLPFQK